MCRRSGLDQLICRPIGPIDLAFFHLLVQDGAEPISAAEPHRPEAVSESKRAHLIIDAAHLIIDAGVK